MKTQLSPSGLVCLLSSISFASAIPQWTVDQVVNTTSGRFQGHPAYARPDVTAFLGIPFAQPPVGDLRFAAPQKLQVNDERVVQANRYGASCPQEISAKPSFPGESPNGVHILNLNEGVGQHVSEDCLTLNLWTKPQSGEERKAIIVFVHGGAFSGGVSNNPSTNGQYFADEQDVVVVTFNYRVGAFGFLGLPGYEKNAGLLDQRAVVEWVRDNAEAFGGDPSRITLVGQSAGASSVDLYSYAWTEDPIVHSIIEESGSATSFGVPPASNEKVWYVLSKKLGCGGENATLDATVTCVGKKSWKRIIAATPAGSVVSAFAPSVDDKVVFSNYRQREATGQFLKVPYILGSNENEEGFFNATSGGQIPVKEGRALNDEYFNCPTAHNAGVRLRHFVPTYRYRYFGDFPNLRLYPTSGAYHTAELSVIFGTSRRFSGERNTLFQDYWSAKMRALWAAFARDPNSVASLGLVRYLPLAKTLNILARDGDTQISYERNRAYDGDCPLPKSSQ